MSQELSSTNGIRLALAIVILVVGVFLGAAWMANRAGWLPHREATTVYVGRSGWEVGEERNCIALPESDGGMIFLGCVERRTPEFSPGVMPVTYWGRTRRVDMYEYVYADPGINTWKWRCRRYRGSLTCWAVN